jgi:outer membrane protein assembly factor BamB
VDGGVAFVSAGHHITAVDVESGEKLWPFEAERATRTPSVAGNTVYVGSEDHHLYALDKNTGQQLWAFETEGWVACPAVIHKGVVYFGCNEGYLYALEGG